MREKHSDYRLLIVGDGPLREEIEKSCRARGFADAVTLTGSVDHLDVGRYLARMDVGVASYPEMSEFYFSPLKVWEYAAASVPIAASASGELPALFPHKEAALLHPPGNARKLARHIERLRDNPDFAVRLARAAHRTARAHTWDRLAARVVRAAQTLARPPSR
jgi:glycosyltransferase involved in cell wall biosynthesis